MSSEPLPYRPWRIIYIPVVERQGGLFPFLFLKNGLPSATAALWARALSSENWSDSKIEAHLRAVGTFYAFCQMKCGGEAPLTGDLYVLVQEYAEARFRGTWIAGEDPTGLYWRRVRISTVSEEIRALDRYSRFVAKLHDSPVFNPDEHALVKVARFYRSAREAGRSDALVHLRGVRRRRSKAAPTINRRMTESDKAAMRAKHLSPAEMIETVEHGARSPRDKMLLLLLGYAGLRISEPLHLYVNDVVELFRETGASKIRLEHPENGSCVSSTTEDRSGFLARVYKRLPRSQLGRGHREFAGWKGMVLTEADSANRYAFWLEESITGRYFRRCLEAYFDDHKSLLRTGRLRHPYLFFNTTRNGALNYGQPLSLSCAHDLVDRAFRRVGIRAGSHACRHHYGFYAADVLQIPQETLMRMMHHSSIVSTDTYYHVSAASVRARISGTDIRRIPYARPEFPSSWGKP
jgi:integrase